MKMDTTRYEHRLFRASKAIRPATAAQHPAGAWEILGGTQGIPIAPNRLTPTDPLTIQLDDEQYTFISAMIGDNGPLRGW